MTTSGSEAIDRRMAVGAALAGAAGLALPRRQSRTVTQRGMVGGGLARFEQGEANFSLVATRMEFSWEDLDAVAGSVLWDDGPAGLALRSTAVTEYIVPADQPEQGQTRHIIGTMSVNDENEYPFELEVTDVDQPGSRLDRAILKVGDGARPSENAAPASGLGFSYMATGEVVAGDIQEIGVEIDMATGVARRAAD